MAFDKLVEILRKAQGSFPAFSKRLIEAEALGRWEAAVGPIIAKHSRAIRVKDSILWVEVEHPIWKSELHYRKNQILKILNGQKPEAEAPLVDILLIDPRERVPFTPDRPTQP